MRPEQRAAGRLASENAPRSRLVSIGSSPPREYPLDKPAVAICSHPSNDVVLDDTTVSRRHATITRKPGGFELADLGSTNGTYVNGGRVRKPIALKGGDEIKFGSVRMAFVDAIESVPARAPGRLARGLAVLAAIFIAGFAVVRYRSAIMAAASAIVASVSSRRSGPAPSAANTQSAAVSTQSVSTNSEATAVSTPAPLANPAAAAPDWLRRVNYYRAMVKLPPIVEDPVLSDGDLAHARYIVTNYHDRIQHEGLGAEMHTEDPGSPGFTPAG